MDHINITLPEISDIASQIRKYNANLDEILSYVNKTMNELSNVWQSDGEKELLSRFQKFATKFIEESEVIESYAAFLDKTVSDYDSLESTFVSNATSFE